jgi:hypothetical protein
MYHYVILAYSIGFTLLGGYAISLWKQTRDAAKANPVRTQAGGRS